MSKRDRWPALCDLIRVDDGLKVRECGPWTEDKLWFWNTYIDITTSSMVGHHKWTDGVAYVDLFAGPGICVIKETGKRLPGSPLIAAHAPKPFDVMRFVEFDSTLASALEQRLANTAVANRCKVLRGDCNACISEIVADLPPRALTLAFVDPEGLDVRFETLVTLADKRRVDLLLLFADAYDVVRNVDRYEQDCNSKLDRMLGPDSNWRDHWRALQNRDGTNVRKLFGEIMQHQLQRHLGYKLFRELPIDSRRGPMYRLIYASRSEKGVEFWDKATRRTRVGEWKLW